MDDLEKILYSLPPEATIFFVPLSLAAPFPKGWNWIKWIWVETEKEPTYRVSLGWYVSPVRRKLMENEKMILSVLNKSGRKFISFSLKDGGTDS